MEDQGKLLKRALGDDAADLYCQWIRLNRELEKPVKKMGFEFSLDRLCFVGYYGSVEVRTVNHGMAHELSVSVLLILPGGKREWLLPPMTGSLHDMSMAIMETLSDLDAVINKNPEGSCQQ